MIPSPVKATLQWKPTPPEQQFFVQIFQSLSGGNYQNSVVHGRNAVPFLLKSGVSREILRVVWSASAGHQPTITYEQFCVALRFVALCQYNGMTQPTISELNQTANLVLPPPLFLGVNSTNIADDLQKAKATRQTSLTPPIFPQSPLNDSSSQPTPTTKINTLNQNVLTNAATTNVATTTSTTNNNNSTSNDKTTSQETTETTNTLELSQLRQFYKHWALKESYIKAVGIGLGFELSRAEFRFLNEDRDAMLAVMYIDGILQKEWTFTLYEPDVEHCVVVALGPLKEATPHFLDVLTPLPEQDGEIEAIATTLSLTFDIKCVNELVDRDGK